MDIFILDLDDSSLTNTRPVILLVMETPPGHLMELKLLLFPTGMETSRFMS